MVVSVTVSLKFVGPASGVYIWGTVPQINDGGAFFLSDGVSIELAGNLPEDPFTAWNFTPIGFIDGEIVFPVPIKINRFFLHSMGETILCLKVD